MQKKVLIEVSAKHVHASRKDIDKLFGKGYKLKPVHELTQHGQFAAEEKVTLVNGEHMIENVRILGPERGETQVELALTDAVHLKMDVPFVESGHLEGTPGITINGPKGTVELKRGVIIPLRHLHCSDKEAEKLGLKDQDIVSVRIPGERTLVFENVIVRVNPKFSLSVHLDTDEGNAAGIKEKTYGELLLKKKAKN
jgi:putative phosphotransacetylase